MTPHQVRHRYYIAFIGLGVKSHLVSIVTRNTRTTDLSSTLVRHCVSPLCSPQRLSCLSSSSSAVLQQVPLNDTRLILNCRKTLLINPSGGVCCCAQINAAHSLHIFWMRSFLVIVYFFVTLGTSLKSCFIQTLFFITVQHNRGCVSAVEGCSLCRYYRLLLQLHEFHVVLIKDRLDFN